MPRMNASLNKETMVAFGVGAAVTAGALLAARLWRAWTQPSTQTDPLHMFDEKLAGKGRATPSVEGPDHTVDNVHVVVMTGGPLGGRTTLCARLQEVFSREGFDVYCPPEVPTLILNSGCQYPGLEAGNRLMLFEAALIRLQLQFEDTVIQIARATGRPCVVVFDRGVLDAAAYLPTQAWRDLLRRNEWRASDFHRRYDLVVHMVTSALGAERHYRQRTAQCDAEAAGRLDRRFAIAWDGHPRHVFIDNATDFKGKLKRAVDSVRALVDERRASLEETPDKHDSK